MIKMKEAGGWMSQGSAEEYLNGEEEFEMDRKAIKASPGIAGFVGLIYNNGRDMKTITVNKTMPNRYIVFFDDYKGKGNTPKKAFFDLLRQLV